MNVLLMILAVQALSLLVLARFHRVTVLRMVVLRQQLSVYKRSGRKSRLKDRDRLFSSLVRRTGRSQSANNFAVTPFMFVTS